MSDRKGSPGASSWAGVWGPPGVVGGGADSVRSKCSSSARSSLSSWSIPVAIPFADGELQDLDPPPGASNLAANLASNLASSVQHTQRRGDGLRANSCTPMLGTDACYLGARSTAATPNSAITSPSSTSPSSPVLQLQIRLPHMNLQVSISGPSLSSLSFSMHAIL